MDVVALSFEDRYAKAHPEILTNAVVDPDQKYEGYESIYTGAVKALRMATSTDPDPNASNSSKPWAARFFAYDRLALVNRKAFESIGAWDTAIPYYHTDCDMHDRLKLYGFEYNFDDIEVGLVSDTATSLDDLLPLYRKKDIIEASFTIKKPHEERTVIDKHVVLRPRLDQPSEPSRQPQNLWLSDVPGSTSFEKLLNVVKEMDAYKNDRGGGDRNLWQNSASGGKGEPYYRDVEGFEKGIHMMTDMGKAVYAEKWGHRDCGLEEWNRKAGDEW
jgi:hypothetical protein